LTNICKLNTLQLHVFITIITGLAVSIPCQLYVSILNFLNQAISLIQKEMNSCCNLYEYGTLRYGTLQYQYYFMFSFLKVDKQ
jgi:hypothetical protein